MSVAVVYCCPIDAHGPHHKELAYRFITTWLAFQPIHACELYVVSNGGDPSIEMSLAFTALPEFRSFLIHDDSGWDIGAFQMAARSLSHDTMVFFGGNGYFTRAGWLKRMMQAYEQKGPTLYGAFGSLVARPHIRTTGFWMPRDLLNQYPRQVVSHEDRYNFEHRDGCLTEWCESVGKTPLMVTWSGIYTKNFWGQVPNAFMNGDHSECLCSDRISDMVCPIK